MQSNWKSPVNDPDAERSPWVLVSQWTSRLTSIALEMALPAVGGYWLDHWLWPGRFPWLLIGGVFLGFAVGLMHLIRLARSAGPPGRR